MRSCASRRPSEKPNAASRPILVTPDGRELLCESELEAKAALVLMARPDCAHLVEQPAPVRYLDGEGTPRHHTFDFLLVLRSSTRLVVAVKPAKIAAKRDLPGLLRHIAGQMDPSFATGILPMTDAMMNRVTVANGRMIHDARRLPDPEHDRRVREAIATLNGATTILSIIRLAGLDGHDQAFYAVVRAIGIGVIVPVARGLITPDTLVRRSVVPGAP